MDKVTARLYDKNSAKYTTLVLPASYEHIEDAYERLGKRETLSAEFDVQFENGCSIEFMEVDNVNLYELNHFANRIQAFDPIEIFKLQGAVQKNCESDYELQKLINIAENVLQSENIEAYPAPNPTELGEFYVENNLIPEIEEIHGDARAWILEHSDYEAIGKEIRQVTGGVFTDNAFVIVGELEELYEGEFWLPEPCEYIFKFEVGFRPEQDDGSRTVIVLPADQHEVDSLLRDYEVPYSDLTDYKFECIIPTLSMMDFNMQEIDRLNELARNIQYFRESGDLLTYKAMVNALPIIDLDRVMEICDYVGDFTLQTATHDMHDYVMQNSSVPIPKELLEYMNIREYGNKLLEKDGANLTEYGVLIPKDGVSLVQKLEQPAPSQAMEMTIQ